MAPSRGTALGHHFIQTYTDCPRKWSFENVFRIEPEFKEAHFIFGGAIHAGRERYYKGSRDPKDLLAGFKEAIEADKPEYQDASKFDLDLNRGLNMLIQWLKIHHEADLTRYEIREVEVEHEVPIGVNGLYMTIRPDLVMHDTTIGETYIFDAKTTSWSPTKPPYEVDLQDQATDYINGMRKLYPKWRVQGLIVDTLYNKGSVYQCPRSSPIYRTEYDLQQREIEVEAKIIEITQKMEASTTGEYPIRALFPRNGSVCARWGCPFVSICRSNVEVGDIPIGFKRKEET